MTPEILIPAATPLAQLERIYRQELPARLHPDAQSGIAVAAACIAKAAAGQTAVYGVNT